MRARIFAFAIACIMVAPQADAQGNRGKSNGVPGQISSIQSIIDAVLAQISALPNFAALQERLTALQAELDALSATVAGLSGLQGQITGLDARLGALEGQLAGVDARIDALDTTVNDRIDGVLNELNLLDGDLSPRVSTLETSLDALEDTVAGLGGGGAASPVIWSGGCTVRGNAPAFPGFVVYCTDGLDFTSMGSRLTVDPSGVITVNEPGLYRINYWGVGRTTTSRVRLATGAGVLFEAIDTTGGGFYFRDLSADATWTFDAGDIFAVQVSTEGGTGNFAYDAWSPFGGASTAQSRLQIEYLGPLPE